MPARHESPSTTPKDGGRRFHKAPESAEWKAIAATLTPQQAAEMLEKDRNSNLSPAVRAERAWLIISQLCMNGYSREAWGLIEEAPGPVRTHALGAFFRDADLPAAELVSMLDGLEKDERASGLYGYWCRFSAEDFAALDMTQFKLTSEQDFVMFNKTLSELMKESFDAMNPSGGAGTRYKLMAMTVEMANAGALEYGKIRDLMMSDPSKDGFSQWDALKLAKPELRATQTSGMANFNGTDAMVIRTMASQDPERTMAMTLVPGSHESNYFHIALMQWVMKDSREAGQWIDGRLDGLSPDLQERAAVAFIRGNVYSGRHEEAAQWLGYIRNPKWQTATAGERAAIEKHMAGKTAE